MMIVQLNRVSIKNSEFTLPSQWNKEGIRIKRILVDGNVIPTTFYYMMGPRTIHLRNYNNDAKIFAEIDQ